MRQFTEQSSFRDIIINYSAKNELLVMIYGIHHTFELIVTISSVWYEHPGNDGRVYFFRGVF